MHVYAAQPAVGSGLRDAVGVEVGEGEVLCVVVDGYALVEGDDHAEREGGYSALAGNYIWQIAVAAGG